MEPESIAAWRRADAAARADRRVERAAFEALLGRHELELPARMRLSALELESGALRAATSQLLAAARVPESDPGLLLELGRRLFHVGEVERGLACLCSPALVAVPDAMLQAQVGSLLCDLSFYDLARERLDRAHRLGLRSPPLDYLRGLVRMYCGDLEAAAQVLEDCLGVDPDFVPALRVLSGLRRQTAQGNHVDRLRDALRRLAPGHAYLPQAHYALFKELDDLGDERAAWLHLQQGMAARRSQVGHDEAAEVALFAALHQWTAAPGQEDGPAPEGPVPIFVLGMPRSGSTLLERQLAAHPAVADAGELRDFNCQMRWCCDRLGGPQPDLALVQSAASLDPAQLGRRYLEHTAWRTGGKSHFIDKLPANYLVAGLIAAALPQARIVHMVREPMDSCFSNLKALFADAYSHSYDQGEMARHFLRYRRLMAHWGRHYPGRILQVDYEAMVADPEREGRRVLDFCGLPWSAEVLGERTRSGMVATASTVQVREPIHRRYVGQWRRYASELRPLAETLHSEETE